MPLMQALRDRNRLAGKCGKCRLRWLCGGCRGIAYAISDDPLAEDPQCFRDLTWGEKLIAQGKRFAHAKPSPESSVEYWPVV
jgi:sulfatase maturation enzyme AslB (radical SAM superfamily)